jgi:hypothetical protein
LIYPKELLPEEQEEAARMLETVGKLAQQLLDELAGQLRAKEIKNPLGYLRGLIAKTKGGKFSAAAGIKIGESQKQKARTRASIKASEEKQQQRINQELSRQRMAELKRSVGLGSNQQLG